MVPLVKISSARHPRDPRGVVDPTSRASRSKSLTARVRTAPGPDAPSSATSSCALEASSCRNDVALVRLGLTGVTVAPNRYDANNTTTNSTRLRNLTATTSPVPMPSS